MSNSTISTYLFSVRVDEN